MYEIKISCKSKEKIEEHVLGVIRRLLKSNGAEFLDISEEEVVPEMKMQTKESMFE